MTMKRMAAETTRALAGAMEKNRVLLGSSPLGVIEWDADRRERADKSEQVERVRVGFHLGAQDAELVAFSHNQFTASAVG